jgi:hypothetical protein
VVAGWLVVAGCWCTSWSRGAKKNTQIRKDSTQSVELGGHNSSNQRSIRLAFSYFWLRMTMGTSSWSEHSYLPFWIFVFSSCLKNFFISEKKLFGLD